MRRCGLHGGMSSCDAGRECSKPAVDACGQMPTSGSFRRGELKACIRSNFRAEVPECKEKAAARLDLVCCPLMPATCHAEASCSHERHIVCRFIRAPIDTLLAPQAFDALRVLADQQGMAACSAAAMTEGVRVEITTGFIGSRIPLDLLGETPTARPVWTYRCRVENVGCCPPCHARDFLPFLPLSGMLGCARHTSWHPAHAGACVYMQAEESAAAGPAVAHPDQRGAAACSRAARINRCVPRGRCWGAARCCSVLSTHSLLCAGVVGCTPVLRPGDCFQYHSATDLSTASGACACMHA